MAQGKAKPAGNIDLALLAVRLVFVAFMFNGIGKFMALGATAGFFGSLGIPAPGVMAIIVAAVETFGSLAMLLGIGTAYAATLLSIVMLVAILTTGLGTFASSGILQGVIAIEIELANLLAAIGIALAGPGKYSLEEYLKK